MFWLYAFSHFFAVPFEILLSFPSVRLNSYTKDRLFQFSGLLASFNEGAFIADYQNVGQKIVGAIA